LNAYRKRIELKDRKPTLQKGRKKGLRRQKEENPREKEGYRGNA